MRYNRLGHTGLHVSELCLGTMTFGGGAGFWRAIGTLEQADAEKLVGRAVDAGVNFIDTADVYAEGLSEQITGQALRNLKIPRDKIVLATKAFGTMGEGPNGRGSSRKHLMDACKASLQRLQLDYIDLYQMHGFDIATPVEETVAALDALVKDGLVRYVGVSNWAAWQVAKAIGIAARTGAAGIASLQAYYTVVTRDLERDIVPMLKSEGVGLMVWSPLAGGLLSGKFARGANAQPEGARRNNFDFPPVNRDKAFDAIEAMSPMAKARDVTVAQIALAWLLHRKAVSSVIIGAKRVEQLDDNLASVKVDLTAEEMDILDKIGALAPEYPGWMAVRQNERVPHLSQAERKTAR